MKKVALSLASVLAAAAFAPEASAIPAFARQTGMACSACHAQHFPVLNGFGRAFKAAGFTMMGSQEKVEGEHLSIPAQMNFGQLLKVRYQKTSGTAGTPSGQNTNGGQWQFPDEYALFVGGRMADNGTVKVGVMAENALAGTAAGIVAGLRVPVVVELDAGLVSVIPFTTDSLGPFYGYTESSNGINRAIRWAEHRTDISAAQYTGLGNSPATGIALMLHSDMGYINLTRYANTFASAIAMSSTAIEIAATPTIADFATIISVNMLSGESDKKNESGFAIDTADGTIGAATTTWSKDVTKATAVSAQAHGELGGMETGLYFQTSSTPADSRWGKKSATTFGADFTVIPHTLSLGAAIRSAKTGDVSDNSTTFMAVYDLAQNIALVGNYTKYSKLQGSNGDSLFTGMLEAAW